MKLALEILNNRLMDIDSEIEMADNALKNLERERADLVLALAKLAETEG